jgi:hypothetical protein
MKTYIGDSVYADCDGVGIVLTTENGGDPSNRRYREPETYTAFVEWVNGLRRARRKVEA